MLGPLFELIERRERRGWSEVGERVFVQVVGGSWERATTRMSRCGKQDSVGFQAGAVRLSLAIVGGGVGTPSLRILERI